ncbi:MAG TPA: hypothetical protein IGS37_04575 [Synechococcales cyanobacterium M55_K2018_004]|nr:hypothetical protein [Synechococcales cyanobacterium M55_K2018_004]
MGDRRFPLSDHLPAYLQKARLAAAPVRRLPAWAILSLTANVLLLAAIGYAVLRNSRLALTSPTFATTPSATTIPIPPRPAAAPTPQLGPRQFYNYQQWVELLQNEAAFAAQSNPDRLTVLLGDSISQWFPPDQLLPERHWLNQGISGETTAGLLQRLDLLDETRPKTILLMIGINDLLRGVDDATLLANYRQIVRYLRTMHPETQLVVQSILPHAAAAATWEGRDRLLNVPNQRIRQLNQQLEAIATEHTAYYLNLYPLFTDANGNLRMELSTDGLHLNPRGYLVWRTALQMYLQGQG